MMFAVGIEIIYASTIAQHLLLPISYHSTIHLAKSTNFVSSKPQSIESPNLLQNQLLGWSKFTMPFARPKLKVTLW